MVDAILKRLKVFLKKNSLVPLRNVQLLVF